MKIGIMGGTFNPPHIGHLHAANEARAHLELDKLILVPTSIPPHKEMPPGTPSALQRLDMTRIAAHHIGADVSDVEINRAGPSYSADTLDYFAEKYPNDTRYFIIGTDMFMTIGDWYDPERIFSRARIAVVARMAGDAERIEEHAKSLTARGARVDIIPCRTVEISSTALRDGECDTKFLPSGVAEYIAAHGLYE
ncbi:MAG: nicotinate (nicotinamide) nucleotide adenylyltransferase [Clostridia bacterium]